MHHFVFTEMSVSTEFSFHKMYIHSCQTSFISLFILFLEVETALRSDNKKQVDISDPFLFPKLEDGSMITFHSILVPRKLEPESQEFGSTSTSDQGKKFRVLGSTKKATMTTI
jgi:hypothetical protein